MEASLEASELAIGYPLKKGKWKIVHPNLSFRLYPGELVCLIGLNGAGKSTLIRTLCRFQPSAGGSVRVMGREIGDYAAHDFAVNVGVVLTDRTNVGGVSVYDLVSFGRHPHTGFFGRMKEEDRRVVRQSMEAVGIAHKASSYVSELSDGERQRAMIARALAQECPVIVLDEPTAFLDVAGRMETMALLHRTAREKGKTILMSTHDIDNAIMYGDKLMLLSAGREICCDTPEELILDGKMEDFFRRRGLFFDKASGRLSIGVHDFPVGVSGDPFVGRWLANALFRNGFSAVSPAENIVNVVCESRTVLRIGYPEGMSVTAGGIAEAVENISAHVPEKARDGKWRRDRSESGPDAG